MRRKQKRRKKRRRPRQAKQRYIPLPVEDWCEIFEAVEQVAANQHKIDNPLKRMMVVITSMCNKDLKKSINAFRRYSALCEAIKEPRKICGFFRPGRMGTRHEHCTVTDLCLC